MSRETLIKRTYNTITKLPDDKVKEVSDFADFIMKRHEEELLNQGIENLTANSKSFNFLSEEEDLYTVQDLKQKY